MVARSFLRREYWFYSKQHELSLLFVAPLWLLYEALAYQLNDGWLGRLRTGADFLIKETLDILGLHPGLSVLIAVVFLGFYFHRNGKNIREYIKKPTVFALMFLESLTYAVVFGLIVGGVTGWILSQGDQQFDKDKFATLVVSIGSGPYEEIVFRFGLIVGLLSMVKRQVQRNRYPFWIAAVLVSALLFAGFHYLSFFGEAWNWQSFIFRFVAGVSLAILFIYRGLGVTTYTHSLYNVLLMFR
ncbi:CPBP family intramembrane metalloprotease [bacterium]|nr:CPBP family intramembrane metalloprotease [bacterium]